MYDEFEPALEPDDPRDIITLCYRRGSGTSTRRSSRSRRWPIPTPFFALWEATEEEQEKTMVIMTEMATMSRRGHRCGSTTSR